MGNTFLIVDGNSLLYRAFHALPPMETNGVHTNAIFGFLSMVLKVIKEEDVGYLAVCFDEHGPTFRHTAYAEYKAGRAPTPPELIQQMKTIRELLPRMGIHWYGLSGWEADDLLGTLSHMGREQGLAPLLLTGDRDALQLVGDGTELMFTRKGISEAIRFTPEVIRETYGFGPEQVTDWKGLAGDSSDNIPGVPGVGDKTAVKLLTQYGTLEEILAHASEVKGKLGEKLVTFAEQARVCKELATIRRDAPIEWKPEDCLLPDLTQGIPALQEMKLNAIVRRIAGEGGAVPVTKAEVANETEVTIAFQEAEGLADEAAITAWLKATAASAQPVAVCLQEDAFSLADGSGRFAQATLGGDLLNPGLDPEAVLAILADWMEKHPVVVHDGKQLLHMVARLGLPLPERFAWDVMLGAYLLNPQESSYTLSGVLGELPKDARGVLTCFLRQQPKLVEIAMMELMQSVEMPLQHVLFRMEREGFRVDAAFLKQLGKKYEQEIETLRNHVFAACHCEPFNLNSTQQLGHVLFEELQLPHGKKTARGYSTSAEELEKLRTIAPEIIEPLLQYRQLSKLNSTYIQGLLPLLGPDQRVHSRFNQVVTATGRISSSEPNLQNIPVRTPQGREIRQAFIPRDGWVLLDADYSQIELRLMAHFSGDAALVDAFRTGEDIHARTASEIFEIPLPLVDSDLRSKAKAVNFGIIYGISGFGLSRNTGVTNKEAAEFIRKYFEKYPGVKRFMDEATENGRENGYAVTLMGRRRYLPELQSSRQQIREFGKRAAMNTPVQGTAADIIKLAMVRVDEALRKAGMESKLILQVHDELLLECPPHEVEQAAKLLKESMEQVVSLSVPLLAEVHQGQNWLEAK